MKRFCSGIHSRGGIAMNEHQVFKTCVRPVIMMVIGLNYILKDLPLAAAAGIGIYALSVWGEQLSQSDRK